MFSLIYLSIACLVCLGMGFVLSWNRLRLFVTGCRAEGSLVRWEMRGLRKMYHHPVIRFTAEDGCEYEFVGMPGHSQPTRQEKFPVLYPAGHPQKAMVHGLLAYWAAPLAFFLFAAGAGAALYQELRK